MIKSKKITSIYAIGMKNNYGPKPCLSQKKKAWAYTKWCEGYNQMQIAEALGVFEKTVRRAINGRPRIRPILVYKESE